MPLFTRPFESNLNGIFGLIPFVLRDTLGNEQNALAHPGILKNVSVGQLQFSATMPGSKKRKFAIESSCQNCSPISVPGLDILLAMSPYANVLRTRTFVEPPESICDLLSEGLGISAAVSLRLCSGPRKLHTSELQ